MARDELARFILTGDVFGRQKLRMLWLSVGNCNLRFFFW